MISDEHKLNSNAVSNATIRQLSDGPNKSRLAHTMINLAENSLSTSNSLRDVALGQLKAGATMSQYSERVVEDILSDIFAEHRGHFPETSSSCDFNEVNQRKPATEVHVDKRLKYWREMLQSRRKMQKRVEIETGKSPEEVLFNRRSTLDNRNKETVLRILDYSDRIRPENLAKKKVSELRAIQDPCCCKDLEPIMETWPQAEELGVKNVEIIGIPRVIQQELLGNEAANRELKHTWLKSGVLDKRIDERFENIRQVVEFFPDLDNLQVTGTNIAKQKSFPRTLLLEEKELLTITTSSNKWCSEEQLCEPWTDTTMPEVNVEPEPEPPEIGLNINGKDYIACGQPITECFDMLTKFKCDPFQRRMKVVLKLKNIGKQTLSFTWSQGVYYYNRATLLLAQDNEFYFDTESFRLTSGESYNLIVLYQPRKVRMAVELWRLQVEPRIFCGNQESLQLRFHGRCSPPIEYMARLKELQGTTLYNANNIVMKELTNHLAEIVPLIEPPPACCPYERALDERELFNSLNPGYHCTRFDDLEVLKGMHQQLKKPREPHWDFRLDTIKMLIMRKECIDYRNEMFANLMVVSEPLLGAAPNLERVSQMDEQKQRTRFIFVRGAICNGIEEWEDLVFTVEESYYKLELQNYYMNLCEKGEEEETDVKVPATKVVQISSLNNEDLDMDLDEKASAAVHKKLRCSKYFRDALYIQTYSHLCNIVENIVSIIESTDVVPT